MLQRLGQYKYLAIAAVLALVMIGSSGYFFASHKSEPVYVRKIDRLIYDRKNQSPRYVLELADLRKAKAPRPFLPPPLSGVPGEEGMLPPPPPKEITMEDILANLPNLQTLQDKPASQTLKYINLSDGLTEPMGSLMLPKVDASGRKPWSEYGQVVEVLPSFKKVAIVVKTTGFDADAMNKLNKALDSEVSFSFSPYARDLGTKVLSSRQEGHETYVDMLLSSKDFLKSDSGPLSMSLTISPEKSLERLRKSLSTGAPLSGVVINEGIADQDNREVLQQLMQELQKRGLLMIDATKEEGIDQIRVSGLARAKADFVIDYLYDRQKIRDLLQQAEQIAYNKGHVLIVIDPKPVIVSEIYNWVKTFSPQPTAFEEAKDATIEKPLALVPVSNLVVE